LPTDEFQRSFSDSIDDDPEARDRTLFTTVPFSFDRVMGQKRSCRLLRVGDPFVDAFEAFTRWDDRGVCYAFWRFIPNYQSDDDPEVYFRFDYVVSPDPQPFVDLCNRYIGVSHNALMRRSWAIMRRRFAPIWVDADLERVTDDQRLGLLTPAFKKDRTPGIQDFNLNRDRWSSASTLYDMSLWRDRCFAARERSEQLLREQSQLPEWSEQCVVGATRLASQVQQQYRSRLAMADEDSKVSLESELAFERAFLDAQIESFRNPELRVDSVGAVFLSSQMPFVELGNDIEDED
jgi:ATP-dependent helicase HepA